MADQYTGSELVVEYGAVDISETARTVTLSIKAAEPPDIDCTHKADTEQNIKEGIPGGVVTSVSMTGLDEAGGVAAIKDLVVNAKDTLDIWPQGKVHTYEQVTVQNARYHGIDETIPYDGAVDWTASFSAKNDVTRGTYDSTP